VFHPGMGQCIKTGEGGEITFPWKGGGIVCNSGERGKDAPLLVGTGKEQKRESCLDQSFQRLPYKRKGKATILTQKVRDIGCKGEMGGGGPFDLIFLRITGFGGGGCLYHSEQICLEGLRFVFIYGGKKKKGGQR